MGAMAVAQIDFQVVEKLKDGREVILRPLRDGDRKTLTTVWSHLSPLSIYHRFFSPKKALSESDLAYLSHIDFKQHVALTVCARLEDGTEEPVAIGRYIVLDDEPEKAEIAFTVDDPYQGLGIGTILMRHLAVIGKAAGLKAFKAYVLAENHRMLRVFARSGLSMTKTMTDGSTCEVELSLDY